MQQQEKHARCCFSEKLNTLTAMANLHDAQDVLILNICNEIYNVLVKVVNRCIFLISYFVWLTMTFKIFHLTFVLFYLFEIFEALSLLMAFRSHR